MKDSSQSIKTKRLLSCFLQIIGAEKEINEVDDYPNVRTFKTPFSYSDEPLYDTRAEEQLWKIPSSGMQ